MSNSKSGNLVFVLFLILVWPVFIYGQNQQIYYYPYIDNLIHIKCGTCHNDAESSGIVINDYASVSKNAELIKYVIKKKIMPPWKADSNYRSFLNENYLTQDEIQNFISWVENDMPIGNKKSKVNNQKKESNKKDVPDLIVKLPFEYSIPASGKDEYITFIIPSPFKENCYINKIQVIPGNKKRVHHIRIDGDTIYNANKVLRGINYFRNLELDTTFAYEGVPFLASYLPGLDYYVYPPETGRYITGNSQLFFNIHYSPSEINETDRSELHIYIEKPDSNFREVYSLRYGMEGGREENKNYRIPADSIYLVDYKSPPTEKDYSVFTIQPHMHLLGKSFECFALTPAGDTIPLINIPAWDFSWQMHYYFRNYIHIPKGTIFCAKFFFDNTSSNPSNPNNPPKDVSFTGMKTTDEMFNFMLHALEYKNGDDKIDLKNILTP